MADVKVKIKLQDTVEDTIDKIRVDSTSNALKIGDEFVNNVSIYHPPKLDMSLSTNVDFSKFGKLSTKNNGANLKSWATGKLSLADGYVGGSNTTLGSWRGYNGYVFGAVPESKQFEVTLAFFGENIDSIIIYGDKNANQFPTKAYLDSNSADLIYSDDPIWAIQFENPSKTHTITFLEWNRGNYNACITFVAVLKNELALGGTYIKNIETLSQNTDRPSELFYGVIPNSGSVDLLDIDGELADYVKDGIIENSNLEVKVFVKGNEIQNHFTTDTEYQSNSQTLNLQMSNKLDILDKNTYNGRLLFKDSAHTLSVTNLYELLEDTLSNWGYTTEQVEEMTKNVIVCGNDNVERTVKQYLESITSNYLYLNSGTFRETLDKFCSVAQLQILENEKGKFEFVNARPIATKEELDNVILIPKKNQMNYLEKSIIKKNKYTGGKISYNALNLNRENISNFSKSMYETLPAENPDTLQDSEGNNIVSYKLADYNGIDALWGLSAETEGSNIEFISIVNDPNDKYMLGLYKYNSNETHNFYGIDIRGSVTKINNISRTLSLISPSRFLYPIDTVNIKDVSNFTFNREAFDSGFDYGANNKPNKLHSIITDEGKFYTFYNSGIVIYNVFETDGAVTSYFVLPIRLIDLSSDIINAGNYGVVTTKYDLNIYNKIAKENFVTYEIGTNDIQFELSTNNELLQNYAYYNGKEMHQVIGECVLEDYRNGISSAKISVNCLDYYNEYGEKVVNWDNGEIIKVRDVIKISGDDTLWRVTGRTFRKQGVPLIDLELQEIKQ